MKHRKSAIVASLVVLMALGAACHKNTVSPPPLLTGAVNTFDGDCYRAIVDAQAAINSLKADISAGRLTATPTLKAALNQAITDYNAANTLWQAYHASAGVLSQAPLQSAVTKLNTDVTTLGGTR